MDIGQDELALAKRNIFKFDHRSTRLNPNIRASERTTTAQKIIIRDTATMPRRFPDCISRKNEVDRTSVL
jgi:hypothetical protein